MADWLQDEETRAAFLAKIERQVVSTILTSMADTGGKPCTMRRLYDDYREDWSQELRDDVILPLGLRSIYGLLRLFPRIIVRNECVLKVLDTSEITDEVCEAIRVSTLYKEEQKEDDRSSGYGSYYNFDRSDYRPPSMPPPLLALGYESAPPLFGQNEEPPVRVPQVQLDRKMLALVRSWIKPPVRPPPEGAEQPSAVARVLSVDQIEGSPPPPARTEAEDECHWKGIERELVRVMADSQPPSPASLAAELDACPDQPLRMFLDEELLVLVNAAYCRLLAAEEAAGIPPFEESTV